MTPSITPAHVGVTVEDLQRSIVLWRDVFGFELASEMDLSGPALEGITGVDGAALRSAMLTCDGLQVELLEYRAPSPRDTVRPRPCDTGATHIALNVEDLDQVLTDCAAHDWVVGGTVQTVAEGPIAGTRMVYVFGPDGVAIELIQPPA